MNFEPAAKSKYYLKLISWTAANCLTYASGPEIQELAELL